MTTKQAAIVLGVTPSRIRQLCASGELKARKIGRDWMIEAASVERLRRIKAKLERG